MEAPIKPVSKRKERFMLYLTDEAHKMLNELYAFKVMTGSKTRKSAIVCDAIKLLYGKEFHKLKN